MPVSISNIFRSGQARNRPTQSNDGKNTVTTGPLAPRSFARPAAVARDVRQMTQAAKRGVAGFVTARAANAEVETFTFAYQTRVCKKMNVLTAPPADKDGKHMMDMSVVMNVSGHTNNPADVNKFAETNKYVIQVTLPNGQRLRMDNIDRLKADKREYASVQDISFPLLPGKTLVEAWAQGSAGVGGYIEGRRYEVFFGKDNLFDPASVKQQAYPE